MDIAMLQQLATDHRQELRGLDAAIAAGGVAWPAAGSSVESVSTAAMGDS